MQNDLLSDILDLMHVRGGVFGRLNAGGSWGTPLQSPDAIKFCAATHGSSWYCIDGQSSPTVFEAGDIIVVNSPNPLVMGNSPESLQNAADPCPEPDEYYNFQYGQGIDFSMVSGGVDVNMDHRDLLRHSLPSIIHIRRDEAGSPTLMGLVELLVREMSPPGNQGRGIAISALSQLLFVQVLRFYMAHSAEEESGWLRVFGDSRLTAALSCMHHDPARKWNLDELAKRAGMSRTSFAIGFRNVMGLPPLTYLASWRMRLASRLLSAGESISEVAAKVGYQSESAFSKAFRHWSGKSPGAVRKALSSE